MSRKRAIYVIDLPELTFGNNQNEDHRGKRCKEPDSSELILHDYHSAEHSMDLPDLGNLVLVVCRGLSCSRNLSHATDFKRQASGGSFLREWYTDLQGCNFCIVALLSLLPYIDRTTAKHFTDAEKVPPLSVGTSWQHVQVVVLNIILHRRQRFGSSANTVLGEIGVKDALC